MRYRVGMNSFILPQESGIKDGEFKDYEPSKTNPEGFGTSMEREVKV